VRRPALRQHGASECDVEHVQSTTTSSASRLTTYSVQLRLSENLVGAGAGREGVVDLEADERAGQAGQRRLGDAAQGRAGQGWRRGLHRTDSDAGTEHGERRRRSKNDGRKNERRRRRKGLNRRGRKRGARGSGENGIASVVSASTVFLERAGLALKGIFSYWNGH
jgi:hypothetical protein